MTTATTITAITPMGIMITGIMITRGMITLAMTIRGTIIPVTATASAMCMAARTRSAS